MRAPFVRRGPKHKQEARPGVRFYDACGLLRHAVTERRRVLDRLLGAVIEEPPLSRGAGLDKALGHLTEASDKVTAAYANQDALRFYTRALEVCELLGDQALLLRPLLASKCGLLNYGIGDNAADIADFDRMVESPSTCTTAGCNRAAVPGFLEIYNHDLRRAEATLRAAWDVLGDGYE